MSKPDQDDEKKLKRVMKYLQCTMNYKLSLSANLPIETIWWVDAAYASNEEMHSQTGGVLSMGKGSVYSTSAKQKLVARSSTKAELIGIHDVIPQVV